LNKEVKEVEKVKEVKTVEERSKKVREKNQVFTFALLLTCSTSLISL